MRKIRNILMLMAILTTQQVFAADMSGDKACGTIANACLTAGFVKTESPNKGIWHDCMKPTILGQIVSGVKVDPSVIKSCRAYKIKELKMELKDLQKAS